MKMIDYILNKSSKELDNKLFNKDDNYTYKQLELNNARACFVERKRNDGIIEPVAGIKYSLINKYTLSIDMFSIFDNYKGKGNSCHIFISMLDMILHEHIEVERVTCVVDRYNTKMIKVLDNLGFVIDVPYMRANNSLNDDLTVRYYIDTEDHVSPCLVLHTEVIEEVLHNIYNSEVKNND